MDNLKLLDQIYELEASCAALVAEAKERAAAMEGHARQEAERALQDTAQKIMEESRDQAQKRGTSASDTLKAEAEKSRRLAEDALREAQALKPQAVAALVERTLN